MECRSEFSVTATEVNNKTSLDASHVQDLLCRPFVTGRGTKRADRQQQSNSETKPTPRQASVLDNCCNLLNKFHIANLILIKICVNDLSFVTT
jgi:hypothetical protein